jgi:uncharacterized protein YraI
MCFEAEFGAAAVRYVSVRSGPGTMWPTDGHGRVLSGCFFTPLHSSYRP